MPMCRKTWADQPEDCFVRRYSVQAWFELPLYEQSDDESAQKQLQNMVTWIISCLLWRLLTAGVMTVDIFQAVILSHLFLCFFWSSIRHW